jgi:hypothetical protein
MMERFTIKITSQEREALQRLAEMELRDFREQAHLIIKQTLENQGLLRSNKTKNNSLDQEASNDRSINS